MRRTRAERWGLPMTRQRSGATAAGSRRATARPKGSPIRSDAHRHERRLHVPRREDEPVAGERAEQREQGRELRQPRHLAQGALPQPAARPRVEAGDLGQHDRDGRGGDRHRLQRGVGHELDPDAERERDGRRVGGQQQHRHGLRMARRRDERPRHAPEPPAVELGRADGGRPGPRRSIISQRRAGRGGRSHLLTRDRVAQAATVGHRTGPGLRSPEPLDRGVKRPERYVLAHAWDVNQSARCRGRDSPRGQRRLASIVGRTVFRERGTRAPSGAARRRVRCRSS